MDKPNRQPPLAGLRHTDANFWRWTLAMILLACGGVMIGDGVIRWFLGQANSSIMSGGCTIFLGIIVLLGGKPSNVSTAEPDSDGSPEGQDQNRRSSDT